MATIEKRTFNPQTSPEQEVTELELPVYKTPDYSDLGHIINELETDPTLSPGVAKIALLGCFERTESRELLAAHGNKAAHMLFGRGMIGRSAVLGTQIIGPPNHGPYKISGDKSHKQLINTVVGLTEGIKKYEQDFIKLGEEQRTTIPGYGPENIALHFSNRPYVDRICLEYTLIKAWSDYNKYLNNLDDGEEIAPERRSLVVVTTPDIGEKISGSIERRHLNGGGVITADSWVAGGQWLAYERSLVRGDLFRY